MRINKKKLKRIAKIACRSRSNPEASTVDFPDYFKRYQYHINMAKDKKTVKDTGSIASAEDQVMMYSISGEDFDKNTWISSLEIANYSKEFSEKSDDSAIPQTEIQKAIKRLELLGALTPLDTKAQSISIFTYNAPLPSTHL